MKGTLIMSKNLSAAEKRTILGNLGEEYFHSLFPYLIRSSDKFDETCDFRDAFGRTYEVKTQALHPTLKLFSISFNNLTNKTKCSNVDHLIFIEYNETDFITVYECIDVESAIVYITKSTNKKMIGFPKDKMKIISAATFNPQLASKMRAASSDYRFKTPRMRLEAP